MNADRILVLVPCYNCGPQIPRVLAQFESEAAAFVDTVLVLDNGSKDDTVEAAIRKARTMSGVNVMVARNRRNVNLGGSHKAAFAHAVDNGFTHVLVLHGDDQGNVLDMVPLLRDGAHHRFDACLGARFAKGSRLQGYSTFRIFGNWVFNGLFSLALRRRVLDLGSGLNLFGPKVLRIEGLQHYADDLRFNIFLLMGIMKHGMALNFFPISWREDDQVSNVKMTSQALKTLKILRDAVLDERKFRESDHREVKHAEYRFDVLWRTGQEIHEGGH
jgi:dolichol-phosphate mannosyltransferase